MRDTSGAGVKPAPVVYFVAGLMAGIEGSDGVPAPGASHACLHGITACCSPLLVEHRSQAGQSGAAIFL